MLMRFDAVLCFLVPRLARWTAVGVRCSLRSVASTRRSADDLGV